MRQLRSSSSTGARWLPGTAGAAPTLLAPRQLLTVGWVGVGRTPVAHFLWQMHLVSYPLEAVHGR
jgi:hypothetical protein